jgi:hypothetical protein
MTGKRAEDFGAGAKERDFFIWICCNPLKRPDSTKGIQGIQAFFLGFSWFNLDLLGFV